MKTIVKARSKSLLKPANIDLKKIQSPLRTQLFQSIVEIHPQPELRNVEQDGCCICGCETCLTCKTCATCFTNMC